MGSRGASDPPNMVPEDHNHPHDDNTTAHESRSSNTASISSGSMVQAEAGRDEARERPASGFEAFLDFINAGEDTRKCDKPKCREVSGKSKRSGRREVGKQRGSSKSEASSTLDVIPERERVDRNRQRASKGLMKKPYSAI